MGHPFEQRSQAEVPATPDEVWAAIASGPGIDSWFMGHSEVQPGANGRVRTVFGEYAPELDVTAWDPARRFAYRSGEAPDGRFIAYEFLIEGRAGGSTVLRTVTSGFLPGDDWAEEFEAMTLGGEMYFRTLVEYLTYFAGRFAAPVTAFGPPGTTWSRDRALLCRALGLPETAQPGDQARVTDDAIGGGRRRLLRQCPHDRRAHAGRALPVPARLRQAAARGPPPVRRGRRSGPGPACLGILAPPDARLIHRTH